MQIVTSDQMRELERRANEEGVSTDALMERAGLAVAHVAWRQVGAQQAASVLVLVGPGNNGADGLVAARHLSAWGLSATVYLTSPRPDPDPKLRLAQEAGVRVMDDRAGAGSPQLAGLLAEAALVVDAVLGTGRGRPLEGPLAAVLLALREERGRRPDLTVLALDLPSGLDADTGSLDDAAAPAHLTVSLGCPKRGLFSFPGAEAVGRLVVADIGIPPHMTAAPELELVTPRWVRGVLPDRPLEAHKGTFGRVLVVAGSAGYIGAAYLACMGVLRGGAGYVTLATPPSIMPILATKLTEATYPVLGEAPPGEFPPETGELVRQEAQGCKALLLGCGLGQRPATAELVRDLLLSPAALKLPLVLDADGLNILAASAGWWERLQGPAVVTPHPGEMGRLLGKSIAEVEADRVVVARDAARHWGVTVLLKGAFTVVASPPGSVRLIPFANPALATAGTGDVLAGVVAALVGQGLSHFDAASAGAFLHGAAGELMAREVGPAGAIASDLLPLLPRAAKALREGAFVGGVEEV